MARNPSKPKRKPYKIAGKDSVKDREGYVWVHVLTADEPEAKRIGLFYKRAKKDFRIEKNGKVYEIFVRKG